MKVETHLYLLLLLKKGFCLQIQTLIMNNNRKKLLNLSHLSIKKSPHIVKLLP